MKPRNLVLLILLVFGSAIGVIALIGGYFIGATPQEAYARDRIEQLRNEHILLIQNYFTSLQADIESRSQDRGLIKFIETSTSKVKPLILWADKSLDRSKLIELLSEYHNSHSFNAAPDILRSLNPMALLFQAAQGRLIDPSIYRHLGYFKNLKKIQNTLNAPIEEFDVANIFVINNDGYVIATSTRSLALGANLNYGSFPLVRLARIKQEILKKPGLTYMDLSKLSARYPKKAAYLGIPIYKNRKAIGTLVYEISAKKIDTLLNQNTNWDKTRSMGNGEMAIFDEDGVLKSNSRYFTENPKSFEEILLHSREKLAHVSGILENVPTAALEVTLDEKLLNKYKESVGQTFTASNYLGIRTLQSVGRVQLPNKKSWYLVSSLERQSLLEVVSSSLSTSIFILAGILFIFAIAFIFLQRYIFSPTYALSQFIQFTDAPEFYRSKMTLKNKHFNYHLEQLKKIGSSLSLERKSKNFLEDIIQCIPEAIFITHLPSEEEESFTALKIRNFNKTASSLTTSEDLRDSFLSKWIEFDPDTRLHLKRDLQLGGMYFGTLKSLRGKEVPVDISITKIETSTVRDSLYLVVAKKNFLRRRLQQQVKTTEKLLNESQRMTRIGSFYWDFGTDQLTWTPEMHKLTGIPREHKPLTYELFRSLIIAEDLERFDQALDFSIKNIQDFEADFRIRNYRSKEVLWVKAHGRVEKDSFGKSVGMNGTTQDITVLRRNELSIIESKDQALRANKAMSQFLAQMSHEIRTPMSAIMGMADLLKETTLSTDQEDYVNTFVKAGEVLMNLVNDILDLSKIEAGEISIENIPYNLKNLLGDVEAIMGTKAQSKELQFSININEDVPLYLMGDPHKLRQVLMNIVGNALKFTHDGFIRINVARNPGKKESLLLSITDSGLGIPEDRQHLIFQRFSQADESVRRKYGGTGLGLAISKSLVNLMGGQIWFKSRSQEGTTFFITLPLREQIRGSQIEAPLAFSAPDLDFVDSPQFDPHHKLRILIADDTSDNRMLFSHFLKGQPFEIIEARNGLEAVDRIKSESFDIVFMDVQMPEMDGYSATQEVRRWEKENDKKHLPIIALTAHALAEDRQKSLNAGCDDHVSKPFKKNTLLKVIDRFM